MKKLLYSFLILSSATVFAQTHSAVKFAVANDIVGTVQMFTIRKAVVQSSVTYKNAATLPQNLKKYSFLAQNGLAEVKIKKGYEGLDRLTLAQINQQYNLAPETPVFIEGIEFPDTSVKVYADIVQGNFEVKDHNGKKTLFITHNTQ
ncbi:MAG: hypothetical protein LBE92_03665 [Chryseobacterium sp.]|jgi:uncharacterized protein Usg|uniref:hypothetical protein n=1 Tax=Chryseobacterium sp. TaxID=1871047 RepID=UPI002829E3EC|nr:hypothetical protein [Chryseobacterium sp.]MDR2235199.1 hypothetical protein [Chryseobacterium sp.]